MASGENCGEFTGSFFRCSLFLYIHTLYGIHNRRFMILLHLPLEYCSTSSLSLKDSGGLNGSFDFVLRSVEFYRFDFDAVMTRHGSFFSRSSSFVVSTFSASSN